MPDLFKPEQFAVRYTNPKGVELTLGNFDDWGRAYSLKIHMPPEYGAVIVAREITPWEVVTR